MNANTQILEKEIRLSDLNHMDLLELPALFKLPEQKKIPQEIDIQELRQQEEEDTLFLFDYF